MPSQISHFQYTFDEGPSGNKLSIKFFSACELSLKIYIIIAILSSKSFKISVELPRLLSRSCPFALQPVILNYCKKLKLRICRCYVELHISGVSARLQCEGCVTVAIPQNIAVLLSCARLSADRLRQNIRER